MESIIEIPDHVVSAVASSLRISMENIDVRNYNRDPAPTIHQIPIDIRKRNKSAYTPKFISIGPYHRDVHQGSYLHEQTRGMKILYLRNFLDRTGMGIKHYASLIRSDEEKARDCYHDRCNGLRSEEFVQMMVLDGCFIIEFLLKFKEESFVLPFGFKRHNWVDLHNDLMLMENQIPFFILKLLLDNSGVVLPEVQGGVIVSRRPEILDLCLFFLRPWRKITKDMLEPTHQEGDGVNVYHLLHLSYLCHTVEIIPEMESPPVTLLGRLGEKAKRVFYFIAYVFLFSIKWFLLSFFYALIFLLLFIKLANKMMWQKPDMHNRQKVKEEEEEKPMMIPTATELNEFGVTFKRKKDAKNSIDVIFENGIMEIPEVLIDDSSNSKFRNYLALEQNCPEVGYKFTSYAAFMDYLVDTASDVALLRESKIIVSLLGCDEDVPNFFNGLTDGLVFDSYNRYLKLFEDIVVISKKNRNTWRRTTNKWSTMLMRDYFGSPWKILSVLGGVTLLAFTATQVVYAIKTSHGM